MSKKNILAQQVNQMDNSGLGIFGLMGNFKENMPRSSKHFNLGPKPHMDMLNVNSAYLFIYGYTKTTKKEVQYLHN